MPTYTWVTDAVPTASTLNANLRDQVITTTTSGARPSGTEGQFIYETDTDALVFYNGSTWVVHSYCQGWPTYTPTLVQSGTVTNTVTYSRYQRTGRMINWQFILAVTGTGTAGAAVTVSLPFTAVQGGNMPVGTGYIVDASAGLYYRGIAVILATTSVQFIGTNSTAANYLGVDTFTAALAAGDIVAGQVAYEATS